MIENRRSVLSYRNAGIALRKPHGAHHLVQGLDLDVFAGEIVALVGESGSGKTLTALSASGLLPAGLEFSADQAQVNGKNILTLSAAGWRALRGKDVGMVFQEPLSALNPVLTIGEQIGEVLRYKLGLGRQARGARSMELLDAMGITRPRQILAEYPHQLSGGMRQRVMLAIAMAGEPALLIADEPTTALDSAVQNQVLELLADTVARSGVGVLFITHDLSVVAQIADRVQVMRDGQGIEHAPVIQIFEQPRHAYTRRLVELAPRLPSLESQPIRVVGSAREAPQDASPLLEVRHLTKHYLTAGQSWGRRAAQTILALDDVSLSIAPGQTVGLVGQSGSGKSTLARVIAGLVNADEGQVLFEGKALDTPEGRAATSNGRDIQMVFQDPYASLNPRMRVVELITEFMRAHGLLRDRSVEEAAVELLETVGLQAEMLYRLPHQLSGGQRQRIGIARALGVRPRLLVCDEPVSALDVSVQAEVLELLQSLQPRFGLSYLFIAHGLETVYQISHRVAVMQSGRIVEEGERDRVFGQPAHAYTRQLLNSMLDADPTSQRFRTRMPGRHPDLTVPAFPYLKRA